MELKSLLKSCAFSAAVLFTGASANADEYVLAVVPPENGTVVPVENGKEQFQIKCLNIDKRQTDALSVVRDLSKKQVFLETSPSEGAMVDLNTSKDHTSFSFNIGSFKFCYTFSSKGGVMKITGGKETDSLQIQNRVDNQTFEIDTVKANMLSITRGNWKTEIIRMRNCNANTVLLVDYDVCSVKIPFLQTSGENHIHNLILNSAHILNDSMMKVDGIFCNINGSVRGYFPPILPLNDGMIEVDGIFCNINGSITSYLPQILPESHSQNAFILLDEDLINNNSTLKGVDSTFKNCTFFSATTSDTRVKHKDSFYELPEKGCYRFILLGNFKYSGEKEDVYCLLRKEDFCHPAPYSTGGSFDVAYSREFFGTCLRHFNTPVGKGGYRRDAFISLFKNVKSVNLQIGKKWYNDYYQPCELKCDSMGRALVIIREDGLHQETHQETQEESSPFPKMK